jgi:hypothetical protein
MEVDGKSGAARTGRNEVVTNGRECGDEPLQPSRGSEALHGAFASSNRQVGVFGPVVEALVRTMFERRHDLSSRGAIRPELVRHDAFWSEARFLSKRLSSRPAAFASRRVCTMSSRT